MGESVGGKGLGRRGIRVSVDSCERRKHAAIILHFRDDPGSEGDRQILARHFPFAEPSPVLFLPLFARVISAVRGGDAGKQPDGIGQSVALLFASACFWQKRAMHSTTTTTAGRTVGLASLMRSCVDAPEDGGRGGEIGGKSTCGKDRKDPFPVSREGEREREHSLIC